MGVHPIYHFTIWKYKILMIGFAILCGSRLSAQYAPPAGQEGSTAIHGDSSIFIDWANECYIERGFLNIEFPELGFADFGSDSAAIGSADLSVVSLGDSGMATLSFEVPISNGMGYDFAVFENSFSDDFLELAFVEVSSDGHNFHRFDAVSLTQSAEQIEAFGLLDAQQIHNLAGKYRSNYGVPFDLEELVNIDGLDVNHIVAVRIVDVVGSIKDTYASFDSFQNKINDPWPTPFSSGGFDLDAVGVIHNQENTSINDEKQRNLVTAFPNPVINEVEIQSAEFTEKMIITDALGNELLKMQRIGFGARINLERLPRGLLLIHCYSKHGVCVAKIIKNG